ncbi:ROK family transcriptional regulator [Nordella sp. HKS 07]|uniref:ROK family transcriptional regulator n=1 Tax=Nordella sp. HKS 07 TaxID=2712222 RepID=UPI0013E1D6E4|nr:ROK family transcriptional regulator [Nordella sp. HKS 07]QIG46964.1 ROK family transcriptional regulator [Nordella sp. HKS 07]
METLPPNASATALPRLFSLRTVVEMIVTAGPITRAEISRRTGLSKQAVSEVALQLENAGWIGKVGRTHGNIGRTGITYQIVSSAAYVVGIDLGGSKCRLALADLSSHVVAEATTATHPGGGLQALRHIADEVDRLIAEAGIDRARIQRAVIGCPGIIDPRSGRLNHSPSIPDLTGTDIAGSLSTLLGVPTSAENDVNLAVLGEHWQGRGRGADNLAFAALGTGIGLGLMINGRLVRGKRGAAGEICFLPIENDPFEENILGEGAFERAIGSRGILARYRRLATERRDDPAVQSVHDIFEAMRRGDPFAESTIDETAKLLAFGLLSLTAIIDPDMIVLGGNIGIQPELVERAGAYVKAGSEQPPLIKASALGNRATLVGALATGLAQLQESLFAIPTTGPFPLPDPEHGMASIGKPAAEL